MSVATPSGRVIRLFSAWASGPTTERTRLGLMCTVLAGLPSLHGLPLRRRSGTPRLILLSRLAILQRNPALCG